MPELPDVTVYVECLEERLVGAVLEGVRLESAFLLRSVEPPLSEADGERVVGVRRVGKRVVIELEDELFLVLHLMIAGRLRWSDAAEGRAAVPARRGLAAFDFSTGTLVLTEAGTKKRASLHLERGEQALAGHDRGGIEPGVATPEAFAEAVRRENHTLKRTLTDPRIFSGIGNAYSDEILHAACLSPLKWSQRLDDDEVARLRIATRRVLREWTARLREAAGSGFPTRVTAFRPEMAVHGKFGEPCPVCAAPVQRIVHASNETNYCAGCQTGGRLLADRALSRLLKKDWPRTLEELERGRGPAPDA